MIRATLIPGDGIGPEILAAVHGSAPDIAGRSVAGRLALLLAAGLALEHVGKAEAAQRLRTATDQTLRADGVRTADLGGKPSTQEFANAIVRRID